MEVMSMSITVQLPIQEFVNAKPFLCLVYRHASLDNEGGGYP